jgi:hypothetical protein
MQRIFEDFGHNIHTKLFQQRRQIFQSRKACGRGSIFFQVLLAIKLFTIFNYTYNASEAKTTFNFYIGYMADILTIYLDLQLKKKYIA